MKVLSLNRECETVIVEFEEADVYSIGIRLSNWHCKDMSQPSDILAIFKAVIENNAKASSIAVRGHGPAKIVREALARLDVYLGEAATIAAGPIPQSGDVGGGA